MPASTAEGTECLIVDEQLAIAKEGGNLLLVDVRLGAEALAREHAATARETGTVVSSPLLVPTTVPGEGITAEREEELGQLGIVLRKGLDGQLRVLEVPAVLKDANPARWMETVLEAEGPIDEAIAKVAREHAVASPEAVRRILTSNAAKATATGPLDVEQLREVAGLATNPSGG